MNTTVGTCAGCDKAVAGGTPVTVKADGTMWHTECRKTDAPKRRGRPPKTSAPQGSPAS